MQLPDKKDLRSKLIETKDLLKNKYTKTMENAVCIPHTCNVTNRPK